MDGTVHSPRELFANVLAEAGFRVFAVPGHTEAVRVLGEQAVDVAVVDMGLPEREGFVVLRSIKQGARPLVPVVMVAAFAEKADRPEAESIGADALLVVPFDIEDLVAAVIALRQP